MGCENSKLTDVQSSIRSLPYDSDEDDGKNGELFTEKHKDLILATWPLLRNDMIRVGEKIFLKIFIEAPEVRSLFPFGGFEEIDLHYDERFKSHSGRFMQAVGAVVENIHYPEGEVSSILHALGGRHTNIQGFDLVYMDIFVGCIIEVFADEMGAEFTLPVRRAWSKVFNFVATIFTKGYYQVSGI